MKKISLNLSFNNIAKKGIFSEVPLIFLILLVSLISSNAFFVANCLANQTSQTSQTSISNQTSSSNQINDYRQQGLDFGSIYKNSGALVVNSQNKANTLGFTTENPKETSYYSDIANGDNSKIDNDAQNAINNTSQGDLMQNGLANRPRMTIKPDDEFLQTSNAITGNPDEVVAMLTGSYGECKPLSITQTQTEVRTCDIYVEPNCVNGSELVKVSGDYTSFNYPAITTYFPYRPAANCTQFHFYSNIYVKDPEMVSAFVLNNIGWDDSVRVSINGHVVFSDGGFSGSCERGRQFWLSPNINLKPFLIAGNNNIEILLGVAGTGFVSATYNINYDKNRICQTINNCQNIPANCNLQSTNCLNVNEQNSCNYTQKTYFCQTSTTTSTTQIQCGSDIYCTNNQCSKVVDDNQNNDFATSIAYLSAINQTAKDNNNSINNLKIFTGDFKSCSNQTLSYNNCCSDSGWGQSIGASCSTEETSLAELQTKKLCHFVGSYCSKKVPLINTCQTTTKSYCCFASKISRVINEQGRIQLTKGWGSPESPNCSGFSPEQLQSLRFDQMDLSEIAVDIASGISTPDYQNMEAKIKQKMEGYGSK